MAQVKARADAFEGQLEEEKAALAAELARFEAANGKRGSTR